MIKFVVGALGALMLSALAPAAELPPQFETCAALPRDSERLLCFDKAVAQIKSGVEGTPVHRPSLP